MGDRQTATAQGKIQLIASVQLKINLQLITINLLNETLEEKKQHIKRICRCVSQIKPQLDHVNPSNYHDVEYLHKII